MSFAREVREPAFAPRGGLHLTDIRATARSFLLMSVAEFQQQLRGSPMKRAKREGLARNAALVLGNIGNADDIPTLLTALSDSESRVRSHAAWALACIASPLEVPALRARLAVESDGSVREALSDAIDELTSFTS